MNNLKVLYFDLNFPDFQETYIYENPKKYGGGRIIPAPLMEYYNNFHIASDIRSFTDVRSEKLKQCHELPWLSRKAIREGAPVKNYIPDAESYDLFFHANTNIHLNLDGLNAQQVVWSVGFSEQLNPKNTEVMYFDIKNQKPMLYSDKHRIHHIIIGPHVEPFRVYNKQDIIFQCSRQSNSFQSHVVAMLGHKYGIQTILAGPIEHGHEVTKYIDNKTVHYLGEISQEDKIKYNKISKLHTQFQNWPTCATLSAKEAMSYGVPVATMPIGGWPEFIKEGVNGFIIRSEEDFINAWNKRDFINQKDCHDTALQYSEDKMISSVLAAFKTITNKALE